MGVCCGFLLPTDSSPSSLVRLPVLWAWTSLPALLLILHLHAPEIVTVLSVPLHIQAVLSARNVLPFLLGPWLLFTFTFFESVPRVGDSLGPALHSSPSCFPTASKVCPLLTRNTPHSQGRSPRPGRCVVGGPESRAWSLWLEGPLESSSWSGAGNLSQVILRTLMFEKRCSSPMEKT